MIILYNYLAWKVTMQDSNFHEISAKYFLSSNVSKQDILNRVNTAEKSDDFNFLKP